MAKSNLGQSFIRSLVRQVGRDAGKVVSNKAFGDAHATPIRMVRSADTSPQYSGKRRTYRHDLDRLVNGGLPSTAGSAKKSLVTLENALEDFLNDLMPIGNANDVVVMKSWIDKSLDFIGDVLKIVDKPDVKLLADDLVGSIEGIKVQAKERVTEIEVPVDGSIPKNLKKARLVFWLGFIGFIVASVTLNPNSSQTEISNTDVEEVIPNEGKVEDESGAVTESIETGEDEALNPFTMVGGTCFGMIIIGAIMLHRSKRRRKAHEYLVANTLGMKEAMSAW